MNKRELKRAIAGLAKKTNKTEHEVMSELACIGLKEEMKRAALRFFHGEIPEQIDEETAEKLRRYLELNPGGSVSPTVTMSRRESD
jgi:hypothetical protein